MGSIELDTDGASRGGSKSGCGGLLRDSNDNWICCFVKLVHAAHSLLNYQRCSKGYNWLC